MDGSRHYPKQLQNMQDGKDSIIEPCTVLDYDPKTMLAYTYGLNSKQYRNNVPVLFSALHLNSGCISPPAKNSTALLFWGAENQPFLMPAQFLPTAIRVDNGAVSLTGSPSRIDDALALDGVESGEHLIRSLGGAYVFVNNLGQVVLATAKLHRVSLSDVDGAFEVLAERQREEIGGQRVYSGPVTSGSHDFHVKVDLDDTLPTWIGQVDDHTLVHDILKGNYAAVEEKEFIPIFQSQKGNVVDGATQVNSSITGVPLFMRSRLYQKDSSGVNSATHALHFELAKDGTVYTQIQNDAYATDIIIKPGTMQLVFRNRSTGETKTQNFGFDI